MDKKAQDNIEEKFENARQDHYSRIRGLNALEDIADPIIRAFDCPKDHLYLEVRDHSVFFSVHDERVHIDIWSYGDERKPRVSGTYWTGDLTDNDDTRECFSFSAEIGSSEARENIRQAIAASKLGDINLSDRCGDCGDFDCSGHCECGNPDCDGDDDCEIYVVIADFDERLL